MKTKNPLDPSNTISLGPDGPVIIEKTADGVYNMPGLPKPPAGYGKQSTPTTMPAEMCR